MRRRLAKACRSCDRSRPRLSRLLWDGKLLVILLGGGTKKRQQSDIQAALRHWRSYKARKAAGRTRKT